MVDANGDAMAFGHRTSPVVTTVDAAPMDSVRIVKSRSRNHIANVIDAVIVMAGVAPSRMPPADQVSVVSSRALIVNVPDVNVDTRPAPLTRNDRDAEPPPTICPPGIAHAGYVF